MDEEMKKRLLECGKGLLDWAQQAGDFVKEQAPLVVQELLAWTFWEAVLCCFLGVLMVSWGIYALRRWGKTWIEANGGEIPIVLHGALVVVGLIMFCANARTAVKVKVAPRLVVLEKIREIVK